jgi:hypothetical protein
VRKCSNHSTISQAESVTSLRSKGSADCCASFDKLPPGSWSCMKERLLFLWVLEGPSTGVNLPLSSGLGSGWRKFKLPGEMETF